MGDGWCQAVLMGRDVADFIRMVNEHPGHSALGLVTDFLDDGECRLRWVPTDQAGTPFGHLYSGAMGWAMDAAANNAVFSGLDEHENQVQLSFTSQMLRGASVGDTLTVVGRMARRGRTNAFADAWVEDEQGRVVCRGQSTHQILSSS